MLYSCVLLVYEHFFVSVFPPYLQSAKDPGTYNNQLFYYYYYYLMIFAVIL